MDKDYRTRVLWLIGIATVVRCILAGAIELGNDEVYYWTYSQRLQWNYFDHPPMVGLWIRLSTVNLWLQGSELFIRLGSIASAAAGTWLLYRTASIADSPKAGFFAACLYTASLYASIIAGVFILPDSPQSLFWCGALFLLAKIINDPASWKYWMGFGLCTGLCMLSKVHGIFIPVGLALYIVFKRREWLTLPQLYVAALVAAVLVSPVLFWNIANDFITYRFHSERVTVEEFRLNTQGFLREVFGQVAYNNPVNVVIIAAALAAFFRGRMKRTPLFTLYHFIALPMIAILVGVALFRNTLPHWSGPAYVTLLPLAAAHLARREQPALLPRVLKGALATILFVVLAGLLLIHFYPGTMGKKDEQRLGAGDFTLDLYGWRDAGKEFGKLYQRDRAQGRVPAGTPVVSHKWFPAAHLDFYFCRPLGIELIGTGTVNDLHHYNWMNGWRLPKTNMRMAYCIVPSNMSDDPLTRYRPYYDHVQKIARINQYRGGKLCRYFTVYRLQGWKEPDLSIR